MPSRMTSVGRAVVAVGAVGLGLGLMKTPSDASLAVALHAVYIGLALATWALIASGPRRAGLAGACVGGWAYLLPVIAIGSSTMVDRPPTTRALAALASAMHSVPAFPASVRIIEAPDRPAEITFINDFPQGEPPVVVWRNILDYNRPIGLAMQIGHCLVCATLAILGLFVGTPIDARSRPGRARGVGPITASPCP